MSEKPNLGEYLQKEYGGILVGPNSSGLFRIKDFPNISDKTLLETSADYYEKLGLKPLDTRRCKRGIDIKSTSLLFEDNEEMISVTVFSNRPMGVNHLIGSISIMGQN